MDLDVHKGEHRLFLILAPAGDEYFARQDELLEGSEEGFSERELLRGELFEGGTGTFDGEPVLSEEAAAARTRFGVVTGRFTALLVGKDGTVKHRFDEPVGQDELYALIDAMPMRRREMRGRGEGPDPAG